MAKVNARAKDEQIKQLGIEPNNCGKYSLSKEEHAKLCEIKQQTGSAKQKASLKALGVENHEGIAVNSPYYWDKSDPRYSFFVKNPLFTSEEENTFKEELLDSLKDHSPKYPTIKRKKQKEGHLLVVDIADLHINKYATAELTGAEYNSKLAVERAIEGTKGLIQNTSGFHIDKILFVMGNDVLNTDNLLKQTTKGTPQDTDVSWFEAFIIAKKCYVECLELCLSVADVDVVHCPSNHDQMSGCFLAETVATHFRLCDNITFDTSPAYRKYYKYGNNFIALEHGDKGKAANLPLVYAQTEAKLWYETKFRYGYLHHVHHSDVKQYQSSKDYIGVNITYLRSPSSADIWHADSTYLNMVAVEGFIHSKVNGRVSHLTHYF